MWGTVLLTGYVLFFGFFNHKLFVLYTMKPTIHIITKVTKLKPDMYINYCVKNLIASINTYWLSLPLPDEAKTSLQPEPVVETSDLDDQSLDPPDQ